MTDIIINDGLWHFVCVTWSSHNGFYEIYLDGKLYINGMSLSAGSVIAGGGSLTIGQEQDEVGTGFSETESFIGTMSYLDIWNYTLRPRDIQEFYMSCEPYFGNLIPWTAFKLNIKGNIEILSSEFCQSCSSDIYAENGNIRFFDNKAFYSCNDGYVLHGTNPRHCLRTSQWEDPPPFCQPIMCGSISDPHNGFAKRVKTFTGEAINYSCVSGYHLVGPKLRKCLSNGTWSGSEPECRSIIHCSNINTIENSIVYYANDKGPLDEDSFNYPVGTLAEVQCLDSTIITGESYLICLENGSYNFLKLKL